MDLDLEKLVAFVSIFSALITNVFTMAVKAVFNKVKEKNKDKKAEKAVYREYSKPIQHSLERLINRLIELLKSKEFCLKYNENSSDYFNYKYVSTLYRLFSVLAWLRLAGRELTFYKISSNNKISKLNKAIIEFKSSLADGMEAECFRLKNVLSNTNIEFGNMKKDKIKTIAYKLDSLLLNNYGKCYEKIDREKIKNEAIAFFEQELNMKIKIKNENEFIRTLCIIESWIYRDWQDAIGDMMLNENKIISYREFEEKYMQENKIIWITRGESIFKDLSLQQKDKYDYRVVQVKNLLISSYNLLEALQQISIGGNVVKKERMLDIKNELQELKIIS